MSSQAEQPSLVLTRRLTDGTAEWIPLEVPQRVPAAPGGAYALIDRADYEAPRTLVAQRQGEDLVVEVQGTEVLVLERFFTTADVAFYPTPDIAGGAGPFSGSPLTPDSPIPAGSPAGEQVVWSAEPGEDPEEGDAEETGDSDGGGSPMLWAGVAGGLGLVALAAGGGGGGSSGGGSSGGGSAVGDAGSSDNLDPEFTSGATAAAIAENSGAGQVVYDANATDTSTVSYSLKPVDDAAAFSINANTGAVTLTDNPNYETKSSYSFTVVATDAAGNSSEQAVSLAINDIADETAPTVSSVALTSAVGAQNDTLNAGDTVTVTVTMSENTIVNTAGGTPRIALNVGGSTVFADYVSGSGTNSLTFDYTVQPGNTDSNGIRIPADALKGNGGFLADAEGNAADLSHGSVANNPAYLVDTAAPTLSSSTPADNTTAVAVGADIVLTFSENVQAGSGSITISNGTDTRTINVNSGSQVSISGNQVTIDPNSDLNAGSTYSVQIDSGALTDQAGNAYVGIRNNTTLNFDTETGLDTSIVVFDLVEGSSSDHSGRTFESGVSYDIYIRVDSNNATLRLGARERWEGTENLGSDDRVILVGDGAEVQGPLGSVNQVSADTTAVAWLTSLGFIAGVVQERSFTRATGFGGRDEDDVRLFDTSLPGAFLDNQGGQTNTMYLTNMPAGILTSQGLV